MRSAPGPARWRLASSQRRLYPPPAGREALAAWHSADGGKGRRLLATDLANESRVAALLSWHFEPSAGRPHLVTSAAIATGATGDLRSEYLVGLWLLFCVTAAIDRLTVNRGAVGLVRDGARDGARRGPAPSLRADARSQTRWLRGRLLGLRGVSPIDRNRALGRLRRQRRS